MITLKDWMECVNYRITEGSEYQWSCYGCNAYALDSWDGDQDGVSSHIVFDTDTQTVYQAEVHDFATKRSYRLFNPEYKTAYDAEVTERSIDDEAYDDVRFVDLETEEDFLSKCRAIMNYESYDTRVTVPIELSDAELLTFMKLAHDRDITFNQLVEQALEAAIAEADRNPEGMKQKAKEYFNDSNLDK